MLQALCWPAAKLAGLACVVASGSESVLLVYERTCPAWLKPWLLRALRLSGILGQGESGVTAGQLSPAARARLAGTGDLRAEFSSGAVARFRSLILLEAEDFSRLKDRSLGKASRS